jgi:putative FmdB family regulatory protein
MKEKQMPTYEFEHRAAECGHIWEDWMSIVAPDPETCPKCGGSGEIIRLISGGSGKGSVTLTGDDLVNKVKADAKQLQKDASQSDKLYANLLGEDKYHQLQTKMDRQRR